LPAERIALDITQGLFYELWIKDQGVNIHSSSCDFGCVINKDWLLTFLGYDFFELFMLRATSKLLLL
jgi:hypothetical protein